MLMGIETGKASKLKDIELLTVVMETRSGERHDVRPSRTIKLFKTHCLTTRSLLFSLSLALLLSFPLAILPLLSASKVVNSSSLAEYEERNRTRNVQIIEHFHLVTSEILAQC